jgi:hypothetical protein
VNKKSKQSNTKQKLYTSLLGFETFYHYEKEKKQSLFKACVAAGLQNNKELGLHSLKVSHTKEGKQDRESSRIKGVPSRRIPGFRDIWSSPGLGREMKLIFFGTFTFHIKI